MFLTRKETQLSAARLRQHRYLLSIGAAVYLTWWFVVEWMLPESFNPLASRLAICSSFLVTLALSYKFAYVRSRILRFHALCASALTLHYFYLFHNNASDINWIIGSYITVVAAGMTLEGLGTIIAYSGIVLAASIFVATHHQSAAVMIPGMVTVIALLPVLTYIRARVDAERQRRIKAEAETATAEIVSRAKSLFLANMSHELRTPLTSIIGFSEMLADAIELSDSSKIFLARLRANSEVLMETVNQILNLTEDEFSHLPTSITPVSVRELVTKHFKEIQDAASTKQIACMLNIHEPFDDAFLRDWHNIGRILRNVFGNALRFTEHGAIMIGLEAAPSNRANSVYLTITVQDTGIGVASADFDRIFEPFHQANDGYDRPFGGSGVGLTVARKIARMMGGDVTIIESKIGAGTTFRVIVDAQTTTRQFQS